MPHRLLTLLSLTLLSLGCLSTAPPQQQPTSPDAAAPPAQPPASTPPPAASASTAPLPSPHSKSDGHSFVAWRGTVQPLDDKPRNQGRKWVLIPDDASFPLCLPDSQADGTPWEPGMHLYFTGERGPVRRSWQPCDPLGLKVLSTDPDDPRLLTPNLLKH